MTSRGDDFDFVHLEIPPSPFGSRDLYQIPEETPSEASRGYVNPNFSHGSHGLNDSFMSLPSTGRLTPAYSQGSVSSLSSNCIIKRPDGSTILVTPDRESREVPSRPLTEKHIKFLKIFSIIAIFLFPPTGVAALIYSILTEKEFKLSKQTGDMTQAKQSAKVAERLLIASLVCGVLMYVIIAIVVERNNVKNSPTESVGKAVVK